MLAAGRGMARNNTEQHKVSAVIEGVPHKGEK